MQFRNAIINLNLQFSGYDCMINYVEEIERFSDSQITELRQQKWLTNNRVSHCSSDTGLQGTVVY